jgi:acetylornithine deacetylase/succinyl-diaminopimelate desuccinylase-like protein
MPRMRFRKAGKVEAAPVVTSAPVEDKKTVNRGSPGALGLDYPELYGKVSYKKLCAVPDEALESISAFKRYTTTPVEEKRFFSLQELGAGITELSLHKREDGKYEVSFSARPESPLRRYLDECKKYNFNVAEWDGQKGKLVLDEVWDASFQIAKYLKPNGEVVTSNPYPLGNDAPFNDQELAILFHYLTNDVSKRPSVDELRPAYAALQTEHGNIRADRGGAKLKVHAAAVNAIAAETERNERIANTVRDLVRIPSQGGIDDPSKICEAIVAKLEAEGLEAIVLKDETGKPSAVVSEIAGKNPGPSYALNAVVDTAPVGDPSSWTSDPFAAEIQGGSIMGRGAADSKAAAAMFIELGSELASRRDEMSGKTILFFDAQEHTGAFQGIKSFLKAYPNVDGMMIGYPGDDVLNIGSRGFFRSTLGATLDDVGSLGGIANALDCAAKAPLPEESTKDFPLPPKLTITAVETTKKHKVDLAGKQALELELHLTGIASHSGSSKPVKANAISKTARLLEAIDLLVKKSFGGGFQAMVTDVRGGKHFSQVPDGVDLRLAIVANDPSAVRKLIEQALAIVDQQIPAEAASKIVDQRLLEGSIEVVKGLDVNVDLRTTEKFGDDRARTHLEKMTAHVPGAKVAARERESWPSFMLPPESPLRIAMEQAVAGTASKPVPSVVSGPSNVGNLLAAHGIPATTGYGVASQGVHAANESIEIESIPKAYEAYKRAIATLMSLGGSDAALAP